MNENKICVSCQKQLIHSQGIWLCSTCNTSDILGLRQTFEIDLSDDSDEFIFIECPGATLYDPETMNITEGVKFLDENDPCKGHKIIGQPVFAPTHTKKRRIKREALGKIRRCQGCQDYTVRMRRPEGPDFFIPSSKFPNRTKLKTVVASHRS
ncbi:MAG: hypothetical protein SGI97_11410 [candidate division Zixibacteria bacterium]|nr:hypothetical protein [candidate division Zixibacteria bacterium]